MERLFSYQLSKSSTFKKEEVLSSYQPSAFQKFIIRQAEAIKITYPTELHIRCPL
jgi:hypothetical protein